MSNRFRFEAETRLIRWGESSSAGRTITLELPPDAGDGHPFKGFATGHAHGQRFRMQFDAIGDDEQLAPPNSPAGTSTHQQKGSVATVGSPGKDAPKLAGEHKERRPWDSLSPQQQAGILCADKGFHKWLAHRFGEAWRNCGEDDAAEWLRIELGVASRKYLADQPNAIRRLEEIRAEFLEWAGRVPVAVR